MSTVKLLTYIFSPKMKGIITGYGFLDYTKIFSFVNPWEPCLTNQILKLMCN